MKKIQKRIFASGRVQGVGYRASTAFQAQKHPQVKGWVRNLRDGRVEAVFSGPESDVLELVEWCRTGPARSQVTDLAVSDEPVDPNLGFFEMKGDA